MGFIKNRDELTSTGDAELRRLALDIADAGIAAADPALELRRQLSLEGDTLRAGSRSIELGAARRVFVIGAGKASYPIAQGIDEILGARIHKGLVTCKQGQQGH